LGIYKNTNIGERAALQLRLEAYNAMNHANFYINTGSAYIANAAGLITGSYGYQNGSPTADANRNVQLGIRLTF
jgi:hypothetical protein